MNHQHNSVSTRERNKAVVTRFLEGTHGDHIDVIYETVSERIQTHGFPGGQNPASIEQYRAFFLAWQAAFPKMDFRIHSLLAEGDEVAVRFSIRTRHEGEFAGIAATGAEVLFSGMVLYRLEDGLIVETFLQPDTLSLMQQLQAA